ncbi:MAG: hypothetical protein QXE05_03385 [Nitrososphaeria archaeon]
MDQKCSPITLTGVHVVERATTVKYVSFRKAVDESCQRRKYFTLTEALKVDGVIVMDACGINAGVIGDCMTSGFKVF